MQIRPDLSATVRHCEWVAERQGAGFFVLRCFVRGRPVASTFINNRDPKFSQKVKAWLERELHGQGSHFLFGKRIHAGSRRADWVQSSRLAHVDADGVPLPPPGPQPTCIVRTSPGNSQFLYELDRLVSADEVHAISKALTLLVGGDRGGHSPAKLLRLPGTINAKPEYDPSPLVNARYDGPVHSTSELQRLCRPTPARSTRSFEGVVRAAESIDPKAVLARLGRRISPDVRARIRQKKPFPAWGFRIGDRRYRASADDRSEIVFQIGSGLRDAAASPEEAFAVIRSTCFWKSRLADGKREDPERLIGKIFARDSSTRALLAKDAAEFAGQPVPEQAWLVRDFIPMKKVTGLYGDGATGKTKIAIQLAIATAFGLPFFGMPTRQGRVYAFLAENDEEDTRRALDQVCRHYKVRMERPGEVYVASRAGEDNLLITFDPRGTLTTLFSRLLEEIEELAPTLVILDTAADLFGGNENDRQHVRQFLSDCLMRIAIQADAAVLLCAHPSKEGLKSGDGSSGSQLGATQCAAGSISAA